MEEDGPPRVNYPLILAPLVVEKVWGGNSLARFFPDEVPDGQKVGEVWVIWDGLSVTNGPLAGKTLKELFASSPADILEGVPAGGAPGDFPLLVKFLDARENLSIQVHPDDDYAQSREGQPYGKCEMWYVLAASDGASVFHGLRRDLSPSEVTQLLAGPSIIDELEQVDVRPGDVLINTPGIIHALGAGIVIFELQQSCDLTYRLYDWDRGTAGDVRRELHLAKGAEVTDLRALGRHKIDPVTLDEGAYRRRLLGACRYFAAELLDLPSGAALDLPGSRLSIVTVLDGTLRVRGGEVHSTLDLRSGQSSLVPAAVAASDILAVEDCRCIRSYVPDLFDDIAEPLLAKGVAADRIVQLGGDSDRSDLWHVLKK